MSAAVRCMRCGLALAACLAAANLGAAPPARQAFDPALRTALEQAVTVSSSFSDRFEAEVWLADMSQRLASKLPDGRERLALLRLVHGEATRARLDPELVLALIEVESNFDRFAVSSADARGLMQVMPFWTRELGRPDDNLFEVRTNLRYGCTILRHYLDREAQRLHPALERYNGSLGQGGWYPNRVWAALDRRWYKGTSE